MELFVPSLADRIYKRIFRAVTDTVDLFKFRSGTERFAARLAFEKTTPFEIEFFEDNIKCRVTCFMGQMRNESPLARCV